MSKVLICGAGKIGRGFIGQLFFHSGYTLCFFDVGGEVVEMLNQEKKYRIDIAHVEKDKTEYIEIEKAYAPHETAELAGLLQEIDIMASSVGANNIESTVRFIKPLLQQRDPSKKLNWLICENASKPAEKIRQVLKQDSSEAFIDFVDNRLGLIETQILRTGMTAKPEISEKEPLALRMHDWWTLPLDQDAFVGQIPDVKGFQPKPDFGNELQRKVFTFNGLNGPISYVGWQNGYQVLHEAACAPELQDFLEQIMKESAFGLINEFGFDEKDHLEFQQLAFQKYRDPALNDPIPRNAKDSKRKVGANERLVGPALLCQKHGKSPEAYAKAIAAGYAWDGTGDEGTKELQKALAEHGIEFVMKEFSGIKNDNPLFQLVKKAYENKTYIFRHEK